MSNESDISPDLADAVWRTSSYSGGQGNCVEVADNLSHGVWVRDTKRPTDPAIRVSRAAWSAFITHLR
ncbi:DUF397 domain-containing protein [Streptomyces hygroscopicus]|uniref:DUF397 domain-containing protein n=1 Tax=Streptomyces hygroscopicus TaxID=1912 RepID=UPI0033EEBE63